ncbi:hypothetical protein [Peribacillus sp. V2I11]|nr:hypothetical protein [Peribacillus sp. V2I11]MDQ0879224.1 hypothetical protein [Peribacillus sp. V2I11]
MVVCDRYQLYGTREPGVAGSTLQQELGLTATQLGCYSQLSILFLTKLW